MVRSSGTKPASVIFAIRWHPKGSQPITTLVFIYTKGTSELVNLVPNESELCHEIKEPLETLCMDQIKRTLSAVIPEHNCVRHLKIKRDSTVHVKTKLYGYRLVSDLYFC